MSDFDLLIRGGRAVLPEGETVLDIGITNGAFASLKPNLPGSAKVELDARGLVVLPGLIDAHVHFNEPGRTHWEGFETGSQALAAGGGTLFFDMPLNAHPPTCDGESFDLKLQAARQSSVTDFAFWGGLVPQNLDQLEALAARGVVGFKAFMSNSGMADFPNVDDETLRQGMKKAAALDLPVAVHAESEALTRRLAAERVAAAQCSARDYLASRPIVAELEAIRRATELAGETGCKLHVVHVSSGAGVQIITQARNSGVDVSCETCPHYLVLTEADLESLGAAAKCAPPLRAKPVQAELWEKLISGEVTTVGSDHSPSPREMKQGQNFFTIWGGIAGAQHTLPLLLEGMGRPGFSLAQLARLTSRNVADRFRLPKTKGRLEPGADADLALVDLSREFVVRAEDLLCRHKISPYLGRALTGRVVHTILRGKIIFKDGKIAGPNRGSFIRPV